MHAARLVPLAGVAMIVLIVIAFVVGGETPNGDDPIRKITSFYRDDDSDQMLAAAFLIWGTAAFLLFASGLWRILRNAETERLGASALGLVGAAVLAVGTTLFAGISFTLADFADQLQPAAMQALNALNEDLFPPLALGVFTFLFGAGASIVTTAALPKWLGWVAGILSIVALTPAGFFAFLAMGVWILIVSVVIFLRGARSAPATPSPAT
jgi:hypothetical protein